MKSKSIFAVCSVVLACAAVLLLLVKAPVPEARKVEFILPEPPADAPPLSLHDVRTMNETSFLKVLGTLYNRGLEPVGPIVIRGCWASADGEEKRVGMTLCNPEVFLPGAAARFEVAIPDELDTATIELSFRDLDGQPVAIDRSRALVVKQGAP